MQNSIRNLTGIPSSNGRVKKNPNYFANGFEEPKPYGQVNSPTRVAGIVNGQSPTGPKASIPSLRHPITSMRTRHVSSNRKVGK